MSTRQWGPGHFRPHSVYRSPAEASGRAFDYVLCANKMTASTDDLGPYRELRAVVSGGTTLVSLQNGVDVEAPLREMFPDNTLISGIMYFNCRQLEPGVFTQQSSIRSYPVGVALYGRGHARSISTVDDARLAEFVQLGDGDVCPLDNLAKERWCKQLWNGAFNPLCAISGFNTQDLLHDPFFRSMVVKVMDETYKVAAVSGESIDPAMPQHLIDVTESSPSITPSMLQDVKANRDLEIETLCGK
jgi:2-dehydropantoate 2-reductase